MCFGTLNTICRVKLGESLPDNEEQSRIKDTTTIELARSALKKVSLTSVGSQTVVLLEGEQQDILQLIAIREAHQMKRATRSTNTGKAQANDPAPPAPSTASQRHQICSQMAEVIHRSGTGVERNIWWKSGSTPGTKDPTKVLQLSRNSANAELAAKEQVNVVCDPLSPCHLMLLVTSINRLLGYERDSLMTSPSTS